jgi:hypothetical protein
VEYHRLKVACPAHVALDTPHSSRDRLIESRKGVFQDPPIVMLPSMGHDFATAQAFSSGSRLGPDRVKLVGKTKESLFDRFRCSHARVICAGWSVR